MNTKSLLDKTSRNVGHMASAEYDLLHDFIMAELQTDEEISFDHLLLRAEQNKSMAGQGNLAWRLLLVKRDLEARGVICVKFEELPFRIQKVMLSQKKRSNV